MDAYEELRIGRLRGISMKLKDKLPADIVYMLLSVPPCEIKNLALTLEKMTESEIQEFIRNWRKSSPE